MFRKLFLFVYAAVILASCGTDTKPSYFTNIIRSDADIERTIRMSYRDTRDRRRHSYCQVKHTVPNQII